MFDIIGEFHLPPEDMPTEVGMNITSIISASLPVLPVQTPSLQASHPLRDLVRNKLLKHIQLFPMNSHLRLRNLRP
jgi:hypothetical protein